MYYIVLNSFAEPQKIGNIISVSKLSFVAALSALLTLSGCEKPATVEPSTNTTAEETMPFQEAEKAEIEWFDGSIEEAFALARAENKPLFFYWGAVWCPPCVEIKQTVFKSQQFIAQSKLFVPVYLDGDTERAQIYAEKFSAKLYPTMIVFNPEGEEVTRLHAGIDISTYNSVLELSLDRMRPTRMLMDMALEDPRSLNEADLQQLAYYSWYDNENALPEGTPPKLFNALAAVAADQNPKVSARLYLQYLVMLAEAVQDESPAENLTMADPAKLRTILGSPELMFACWGYLVHSPGAIISVLNGSEAEIENLQNNWATAVRDNRHDASLSTTKQMFGWLPYLAFHFEEDEEKKRLLPKDVIVGIRADGKATVEKTRDSSARLSVINAVSGVYQAAELTDDARSLLTAELEKSKAPHYLMNSLAYLEEKEGHTREALEWYRKAYEASSGSSTRFIWGAGYIQALTRLAPENSEVIQETTAGLFDELHSIEEAFAGLNFMVLRDLSGSLEKWDKEHQPEQSMLTGFHTRLEIMCGEQVADSLHLANCTSLLAPLEETFSADAAGSE